MDPAVATSLTCEIFTNLIRKFWDSVFTLQLSLKSILDPLNKHYWPCLLLNSMRAAGHKCSGGSMGLQPPSALDRGCRIKTRHRASTSMYSLTFCVRVMSPERHHWKPAVQAASVMLRTPPRRRPVTGQPATPTCDIRRAMLRTPPSPAGH